MTPDELMYVLFGTEENLEKIADLPKSPEARQEYREFLKNVLPVLQLDVHSALKPMRLVPATFGERRVKRSAINMLIGLTKLRAAFKGGLMHSPDVILDAARQIKNPEAREHAEKRLREALDRLSQDISNRQASLASAKTVDEYLAHQDAIFNMVHEFPISLYMSITGAKEPPRKWALKKPKMRLYGQAYESEVRFGPKTPTHLLEETVTQAFGHTPPEPSPAPVTESVAQQVTQPASSGGGGGGGGGVRGEGGGGAWKPEGLGKETEKGVEETLGRSARRIRSLKYIAPAALGAGLLGLGAWALHNRKKKSGK